MPPFVKGRWGAAPEGSDYFYLFRSPSPAGNTLHFSLFTLLFSLFSLHSSLVGANCARSVSAASITAYAEKRTATLPQMPFPALLMRRAANGAAAVIPHRLSLPPAAAARNSSQNRTRFAGLRFCAGTDGSPLFEKGPLPRRSSSVSRVPRPPQGTLFSLHSSLFSFLSSLFSRLPVIESAFCSAK